jgi:endoglucanase
MYLEQLSNACGVSSDEGDIRKMILEALRPHADTWRVDPMGNLFVTRHAAPDGKPALRVMVTAHMDEVGFMITKIAGDGRLKFKPVGGFDRRVLPGKAVVVGRERVPGVIGLKPVHLLDREQRSQVEQIDSMYIDVGDGGKVKVGDFATFATEFAHFGGPAQAEAKSGRVKGKAFDNRAGCAVLIELLTAGAYPVEVIGVFTVQEEIGMRGARVAAYAANPDLAFILESTAAGDTPPADDEQPDDGFPRLGDGPAITVMDNSFIADRRLVDLLINTAEAEGIPYQFKRPGIGSTDAGAVHLAREGVPSVVVSTPTRYIHSPVAVLDLADFWHMVRLMQAVLRRLPGGKDG